MDRLNYHHLLYFFTVACEGSIARASARLQVAQPTISAQIHLLEKELGHKLLERSGRGLKVTPAGETVLRYASSIFALGGEMVSALDGEANAVPAIAAGVSSSLPKPLVAALMGKVLGHNSRQRLTIMEAGSDELAERVAARALQFAFTEKPASTPGGGLRSRVLLHSPLALFAPPALARKLSRDFSSRLAGTPVAMPPHGVLREEAERWLARKKVPVKIVAEMPDPEFYAAAAGAAIFAPLLLRPWLRSSLGLSAAGELKGSQWRAFLVTGRGGAGSAAAEAITAAVKQLR